MGTHSRHCRQTKGVGRQLGPVGHPVSKISPKGHPAISARWSVGGVQKGTSRLVGGAKRLVPDPRWRRLNPPQLGCPHSLTFLNSPGRPYTFAPCGPFEGRILLALVSITGNSHLQNLIGNKHAAAPEGARAASASLCSCPRNTSPAARTRGGQ